MQKISFNDGWIFYNDIREGEKQKVTLPHDAMQTEKRIPKLKNGDAMGYYPGGRYVYEKEFSADDKLLTGVCLLEFEGIYQKSQIYLNDELVGGRIYGYSDFFVDLTGKLKKMNRLKVVADNSQTPNSRWYSGSGIYRNVWMHRAGKQYIHPQGVRIITKSIDTAVLAVEVNAVKTSDMEVVTEFFYKNEKVAEFIGEKGEITIPEAKLWSAETPELYDIRVQLKEKGLVVDETWERTGIRKLSWSHKKGFQVNGKTVKLRGGCVHHDHGPLGACSFYNAEKRRARRMKNAGFNAIRYAHNPANKTFLDACDEVGLYVMDETFDMWEQRKSDRDYGLYFPQEWEKDVVSMIRVAYNHPSVVLYSIGNEILDIGLPSGAEWTKKLVECCHSEDPSRPVLNAFSPGLICMAAKGIGINKSKVSTEDAVDPYEENGDSKASGSKLVNILITIGPLISKLIGSPKKLDQLASPSIGQMDISGYNYGLGNYETHEKNHPDCVLCGSETFNSGIAEHWDYVMKHDCMIGEFVWTAWDYLGEAGIGLPRYEGMTKDFSHPYPSISGACGCFDLAGHLEGQGAHVISVWGQSTIPYIGVRPPQHVGEKVSFGRWRNTDTLDSWSWTGCEGKMTEVQVYASGYETELFLNEKSLGRKRLTDSKATYETVYTPGILRAECYDEKGNLLGSGELKSAGNDVRLKVMTEPKILVAKEKDVAYIEVSLADQDGNVRLLDERRVDVSVEGAGVLAAVGSGNPMTEEAYTGNSFTTYHGRMLAIVRTTGETGEIRVTVKTEGLPVEEIRIQAV